MNEIVAAITRKRISFILENREKFAEAFIAETGLSPSECEMVERTIDEVNVGISFRKKKFATGQFPPDPNPVEDSSAGTESICAEAFEVVKCDLKIERLPVVPEDFISVVTGKYRFNATDLINTINELVDAHNEAL